MADPVERPRDRRHRADDGLRRAPGGRLPRGHRGPDQPADAPGRRRRPRRRRTRRRSPARPRSSTCASRPTTRRSSSSSTRSSPRRSSAAPRTSTSRPTGREHARALPRRRRAQRRDDRPAAHGQRRDLARQDHERPRHRRAARAPGRPRRPDDRRPPVDLRVVTLPSVHGEASSCASSTRATSSSTSTRSAWPSTSAAASSARSASPTAPCSSPVRPARASRRRCTRRSAQINTPEKNIITIEDPVEYQIDGHHAGAGQPEGRAARSPPACAR